jgi:hypothetical protein
MKKPILQLLLLAALPLAAAPAGKIAADLQSKASAEVDVLVQFDGMPAGQHHQAILSKGGKLKASFPHIAAEAYTVPSGAIKEIAQIPGVIYLSPDRRVDRL